MNEQDVKRAMRLLRAWNAGQEEGGYQRECFRVELRAEGIVFNPQDRQNRWEGATASEALEKGEAALRQEQARLVAYARERLGGATKRAEAALIILSEPL